MSVSEAEAKEAFTAMDTDKSGFIEAGEFCFVMDTLDEPLTPEEVKAALATIDTSGDGKISFEEFFKWYGDSSRVKSEKTGLALNLLKAKLLLKKARHHAKTHKADLLKREPSTESAISVGLGEFADPVFSVKAQYANDYPFPDEFKENPVEDAQKLCLMMEMRSADAPGWREYVQKVADAAAFGVTGAVAREEEFGGFKIEIPDAKDTVVRFMLCVNLKGRDGRKVGRAASMVPLIAANTLKVEVGFNPVDFVQPEKMETVTIQDFFKVRAKLTGGLPAVVAPMMGQLGPMLENVGMTPDDITGLGDLIEGKENVAITLESALEKVTPMIPVPIDAPLLNFLPMDPKDALGQPQAKMALAAARAGITFLGRDLEGLKAFKMRTLVEGEWHGMNVDFEGFEVAKIAGIIDALFAKSQSAGAE